MFNFIKNFWRLTKEIRSIGEIFPVLMTLATRHDRMRIDPKWIENNWTHNMFRVYELIFWKRWGIGPAMAWSEKANGEKIVQIFTLEAALAHFEGIIRRALKREWIPFRIVVPQMAMAGGMTMPRRGPYLFAIAFGASQGTGSAGSANGMSKTSLTLSGTNLCIVFWATMENGTSSVGSYNWDNGSGGSAQALSQISTYQVVDPFPATRLSFWGLANPNISNSRAVYDLDGTTNLTIGGASYTGVVQSSPFTTGSHSRSSTSPGSQADTSDADGSWHIGFAGSDTAITEGTDTTRRVAIGNSLVIDDSNATVANGVSHTFNWSWSGGGKAGWITTMMRPAASSGPANLKTYNTNAKANIKTMNTNAIANVKSFDTNT